MTSVNKYFNTVAQQICQNLFKSRFPKWKKEKPQQISWPAHYQRIEQRLKFCGYHVDAYEELENFLVLFHLKVKLKILWNNYSIKDLVDHKVWYKAGHIITKMEKIQKKIKTKGKSKHVFICGVIHWTLAYVPQGWNEENGIVGSTAKEFVQGIYNPQTGHLNFFGYAKEDPVRIIMEDVYSVQLSKDREGFEGATCGFGNWRPYIVAKRYYDSNNKMETDWGVDHQTKTLLENVKRFQAEVENTKHLWACKFFQIPNWDNNDEIYYDDGDEDYNPDDNP